MKRRIIILALFVTTLASAQTEHIVKLGTRMMSLEAVNSYPQKLLEVCENSDTAVIIRIKTFNEWEDLETVNRLRQAPCISDKVYDAHLQRYLQPTTYVNSHSETTKRVADLGLVLITYHLSHFHADYPRNLELSATILNFATSNN